MARSRQRRYYQVMGYTFSHISKERLSGVDSRLKKLFELAITRTPVDFGISWMGGLRTEEEQHELFLAGKSTKDGVTKKSKHQVGLAVDFIPYVNGHYTYEDKYHFIIIGVIFACADELGVKIRSGGNWDGDDTWVDDQSLKDLPHIELI